MSSPWRVKSGCIRCNQNGANDCTFRLRWIVTVVSIIRRSLDPADYDDSAREESVMVVSSDWESPPELPSTKRLIHISTDINPHSSVA